MDKRRLWNLIGAPGLAVTSLLFVFLLLGWQKAGATQDGDGVASETRAPSAAFAVSGTIVCWATGPISDVAVSVWNQEESAVVVSDTTDSRGAYSVTLDEGTYYVEFIPPIAAGLDAEAFTTMEIVTNTASNVDFCACSGVWLSETIDSEDAGAYQSLALESTYPYTPHVAYYVGYQNVRYAWLSGTTWITERVDSGGVPVLALASAKPHTPCIAYSSNRSAITKFAYRLDATTWISMMVFGHYSGQKPSSLALEPAYPYNPHICFYEPFGAYYPTHAYLSGTTWMSGTWVYERLERFGVCGRDSIALEQTSPYTAHMSYMLNGDLKHAWKDGTTWPSETVESKVNVKGHSLVLDSSGNPHIAYHNATDHDLVHAWKCNRSWFSETVDSEGAVGGWPSLVLDRHGNVHIGYYDATNKDLKYARFDDGVWIIQTVDSEGDKGWACSLTLDGMGCPRISYGDRTSDSLKYAYIPPWWVYLPLIMHDCAR